MLKGTEHLVTPKSRNLSDRDETAQAARSTFSTISGSVAIIVVSKVICPGMAEKGSGAVE